jgi:hypothetical protein
MQRCMRFKRWLRLERLNRDLSKVRRLRKLRVRRCFTCSTAPTGNGKRRDFFGREREGSSRFGDLRTNAQDSRLPKPAGVCEATRKIAPKKKKKGT